MDRFDFSLSISLRNSSPRSHCRLISQSVTSYVSLRSPDDFREQESFASASLFADTSSVVPFVRPKPTLSHSAIAAAKDALAADNEEDDLYATAPKRKLVAQGNSQASLVVEPSVENGADEDGIWRWLATVTPTGNLEVRLLISKASMELIVVVDSLAADSGHRLLVIRHQSLPGRDRGWRDCWNSRWNRFGRHGNRAGLAAPHRRDSAETPSPRQCY